MKSWFQAFAFIVLLIPAVGAGVALAQNTSPPGSPPLSTFRTGDGTVEGRVLNKDGKPEEGLRVGMMPFESSAASDATQTLLGLGMTDSDGRYRIESIPPGRYFIVVGPLDALIYFPGVRTRVEALAVNVTAGSPLKDRDFQLSDPVSVSVRGRVVGEGRSSASQVTLVRESTALTVLARSNASLNASVAADGSFQFPRVAPGRYKARVTPITGFSPVTLVINEDITNLELSVPLSFSLAARLADMQQLKEQGLLGPDERLIASLRPEFAGLGERRSSIGIAADGTFSFAGIQPGNYNLRIEFCEFDSCNSYGGIIVTVADKDIDGLAVSSGRTRPAPASGWAQFWNALDTGVLPSDVSSGNGLLKGVITVQGAAVIPQVRVRFTTGALTRTVVTSGSSFSLELPPGRYTVALADLPAEYRILSIMDGATDLRTQPLIIGQPTGASRSAPPRIQVVLTR